MEVCVSAFRSGCPACMPCRSSHSLAQIHTVDAAVDELNHFQFSYSGPPRASAEVSASSHSIFPAGGDAPLTPAAMLATPTRDAGMGGGVLSPAMLPQSAYERASMAMPSRSLDSVRTSSSDMAPMRSLSGAGGLPASPLIQSGLLPGDDEVDSFPDTGLSPAAAYTYKRRSRSQGVSTMGRGAHRSEARAPTANAQQRLPATAESSWDDTDDDDEDTGDHGHSTSSRSLSAGGHSSTRSGGLIKLSTVEAGASTPSPRPGSGGPRVHFSPTHGDGPVRIPSASHAGSDFAWPSAAGSGGSPGGDGDASGGMPPRSHGMNSADTSPAWHVGGPVQLSTHTQGGGGHGDFSVGRTISAEFGGHVSPPPASQSGIGRAASPRTAVHLVSPDSSGGQASIGSRGTSSPSSALEDSRESVPPTRPPAGGLLAPLRSSHAQGLGRAQLGSLPPLRGGGSRAGPRGHGALPPPLPSTGVHPPAPEVPESTPVRLATSTDSTSYVTAVSRDVAGVVGVLDDDADYE